MSAVVTKTAARSRPQWEFGAEKVLEIPPTAHTYEGFRRWVSADDFPEKLRVTYLDGKVWLDMGEESIQTHVAVKTAVYTVLGTLMTVEDLGEFYPDGVMIGNEDAEVSNNPDGAAALWESIESGRVWFRRRDQLERAVEGSPDWIMEIVSASSVTKDTQLLREAYHRARITEYWLIDARGDQIVFRILIWHKSGYIAARSEDGWMKSKVFGRYFRLTRRRNRRGAWLYTLETRGAA